MAILKNYNPVLHDIHTYHAPATLVPLVGGEQKGFNAACQGAAVDWSGVSLRPRAFAREYSKLLRGNLTTPYIAESINFWNTTNPAAVLISPKHALICEHYRGPGRLVGENESYTFLGKSGTRHTRKVVKVTFSIGPDHTLLEFESEFPKNDVCVYDHIADARYIPLKHPVWVFECEGKAYKMRMDKSFVSSADVCSGFGVMPIMDGINEGAQAGGWPVIWGGDSGSPAFVIDGGGHTIFVGLMNGGMQVNAPEIRAINAQIQSHGYTVTHVMLSSKIEDLNDDGKVDGADLAMLLGAWGNNNIFMDINGDGKIDGADVAQLQAAWGAYTMARNVPVPVAPPATISTNKSGRTQNKTL
jgi:hypothetical protein